MKARSIRAKIKKAFPALEFTVRMVDFTDLARDRKYCLKSSQWGMVKGNNQLYWKVRNFVKDNNIPVLVVW